MHRWEDYMITQAPRESKNDKMLAIVFFVVVGYPCESGACKAIVRYFLITLPWLLPKVKALLAA
jgi:hypothetical protein